MGRIASRWIGRGAHVAPRSGMGRLALFVPASLAVVVAVTASYEMAAARISAATADAATALLEGHALDRGSLVLQGWSLSLDSFWGLEALFYALILPFTGIHLYVLHLEPALVATTLFGSAVLLGTVGQRRRAAIVAVLVLVALIAFPSPDLAYFLLQGPWHITTALACFVAFYLVANSSTYLSAAVAGVILAVAATSDATAIVLGIVPVLAVGSLQLIRTRRVRVASPMLSAGLGAAVLFAVIHEFGKHLGMYTLVNRNLIISTKQLRVNLNLVVPHLRALFGVGTLAIPSVGQRFGAYEIVRVLVAIVVVVVVLACCYRALKLMFRLRHTQPPLSTGRLIEALLLVFFILDVAFFVIGSAKGHVEFTKYLTPGVLAISIVTARVLGEVSAFIPRYARRASAVVGLCAVALCGAQFFSTALRTAPFQKSHQLAVFLDRHHLGAGIASYPIASLVSVDSALREPLRPVSVSPAGDITTFGRQEDARWYSGTTFGYLVFDSSTPWHNVNLASAEHTYGTVSRIYAVGPYRVLTWSHRITVQPSPVSGSSPLHVIFDL